MEDSAKLKGLSRVTTAARENKRDMIITGERSHHDELQQLQPVINDHVWLDRPVDLEMLTNMVQKLTSKKRYDF